MALIAAAAAEPCTTLPRGQKFEACLLVESPCKRDDSCQDSQQRQPLRAPHAAGIDVCRGGMREGAVAVGFEENCARCQLAIPPPKSFWSRTLGQSSLFLAFGCTLRLLNGAPGAADTTILVAPCRGSKRTCSCSATPPRRNGMRRWPRRQQTQVLKPPSQGSSFAAARRSAVPAEVQVIWACLPPLPTRCRARRGGAWRVLEGQRGGQPCPRLCPAQASKFGQAWWR